MSTVESHHLSRGNTAWNFSVRQIQKRQSGHQNGPSSARKIFKRTLDNPQGSPSKKFKSSNESSEAKTWTESSPDVQAEVYNFLGSYFADLAMLSELSDEKQDFHDRAHTAFTRGLGIENISTTVKIELQLNFYRLINPHQMILPCSTVKI